jgi:acetoin utilization protein AcuB
VAMRHDPIDPGWTPGAEGLATPRMIVADYMTCPAVTIGWEEPLARASRLMEQLHIRHLPVVDADGRLVGIITDGDVREAVESARVRDAESAPATLIVGKVMARDAVSVAPACDLADAAGIMRDGKYSALPVVDGLKVVGILSEIDVLAAFVETLRR